MTSASPAPRAAVPVAGDRAGNRRAGPRLEPRVLRGWQARGLRTNVSAITRRGPRATQDATFRSRESSLFVIVYVARLGRRVPRSGHGSCIYHTVDVRRERDTWVQTAECSTNNVGRNSASCALTQHSLDRRRATVPSASRHASRRGIITCDRERGAVGRRRPTLGSPCSSERACATRTAVAAQRACALPRAGPGCA